MHEHWAASGEPVFHIQARHTIKLALIGCYEAQPMGQASGCQPQIVGADHPPLLGELRREPRVGTSGRHIDRQQGESLQYRLNPGGAAVTDAGFLSPMDTM